MGMICLHVISHASPVAVLQSRLRSRGLDPQTLSAHCIVRASVAEPATSAAGHQAPAAALKKTGFCNKQRFVVPPEVHGPFKDAWAARAAHMEAMPGFQGYTMQDGGDDEFIVESRWASIPEWEAFSLSKPARRQHLPSGIWQYVPKPGEGFPEDFVPFVSWNTFVQAKYAKGK